VTKASDERAAVEDAATVLGNAIGTVFARLILATGSIERAEAGTRRYCESAVELLMHSPLVTVVRTYFQNGAEGDARLLITEMLTLRDPGGRS